MTDKPWQQAPMRDVALLERDPVIRETRDGTLYITHARPLPPWPDRVTDALVRVAAKAPDRLFLADRKAGGDWRRITYGEMMERVLSLGQALLAAGLSAERPLAILSGNDIEHASLGLAAMHVGIPYAPISPAYAQHGSPYSRLRETLDAITPGLIYAADRAAVAPALAEVAPDVPLIGDDGYATMLATEATEAVDAAYRSITPQSVAKFLFTSGSTGSPKAVPNTHLMICSNQEMHREGYAYMKTEPPVVLDWAPWHHTAGGNAVFYMVLTNGGSLYIDDGRPTVADMPKTVRNLRDVRPTWYFNVPAGYDALIPWLEDDPDLCEALFGRLKMLWYAGASMPQHTWDSLERLAVRTTGERVLIGAGLGATETAPAALFCIWPQSGSGNVGLPVPGVELKLVPIEGRYDARVRGPSVMNGYWRRPDLNGQSFDDEGFYRFGDALMPVDPSDLTQGFRFDGRTAENFKLQTGTWVTTGTLRLAAIEHFGTLIRDLAIVGPDRPYLAAIVFPAQGTDADDPAYRAAVLERLESFARTATGSSNRICRCLLAERPPSYEAGELTDKGTINQRAVLAHRRDLVEELYAGSPRTLAIAQTARA